jgi:hypothetical protein
VPIDANATPSLMVTHYVAAVQAFGVAADLDP